MKRNNLIKLALITIMAISSSLFAQQAESSKINLMDYDELNSYLNLDIEQQEIIKPLIDEIKTVKDQDEKTMKDMRSKMQSMGMPDPSLREKMMKERSERQNKIDELTKKMEQSLNKEQIAKFKKIEKPNLMNKSKRMGGMN